MKISIEKTHIDDLIILKPDAFVDHRGFFMETFKKSILDINFVQDNHSGSIKNVIRGLHFQWDPPMGKLMRVTKGTAYLVAVDIRKNSKTIGKHYGLTCSDENRLQIYAPAGFARGFCVLSDYAEIQYKCTAEYSAAESGISLYDPEIGIEWPINLNDAIISEKDKQAQTLKEWLHNPLSNHF